MDTPAFTAALRQYATLTKKALPAIFNQKLFHILLHARAATPEADRSKIQATFGVTQSPKVTKKGKQILRKGKIIRVTDYSEIGRNVYRILQWKLKQRGLAPHKGRVPAGEAEKFIARRLRSIGTMKSGWTAAIAKLGSVVNQHAPASGPRVKQKSLAKPAQESWSPVAEASYQLQVHKGQRSLGIDPRVVAALQSGFSAEARSTVDHLAEKLQAIAREFSAK